MKIENYKGNLFASPRGYAFELRCYELLPNRTFTITSLPISKQTESLTRNVSFGRLCPLSEDWKNQTSWQTGVLYVDDDNQMLPSVDGLQLNADGELLLLQFASGPKHTLTPSGFVAIFKALQGRYDKTSLIIVVPENSQLQGIQGYKKVDEFNTTYEYKQLIDLKEAQWRLVRPATN
jgi:hypothetical protein